MSESAPAPAIDTIDSGHRCATMPFRREIMLWLGALFLCALACLMFGWIAAGRLLAAGANPRQKALLAADQAWKTALGSNAAERPVNARVAETQLRAVLQDDESNPLLRKELALVLEMEGRQGDALLEQAQAALSGFEQKPAAARVEAGHQALQILHRADAFNPEPVRALSLLFTACVAAGEQQGAQEALARLSPHVSAEQRFWMQGKIAEMKGDVDGMMAFWTQCLKLHPVRLDVLRVICFRAETPALKQQAVQLLQQALKADSSMAEAWHLLAIEYAGLGNRKEALAAMEQAYEHASDNAEIAQNLADLLEQDGQIDRSRQIRQLAVQLNPKLQVPPLLVSEP